MGFIKQPEYKPAEPPTIPVEPTFPPTDPTIPVDPETPPTTLPTQPVTVSLNLTFDLSPEVSPSFTLQIKCGDRGFIYSNGNPGLTTAAPASILHVESTDDDNGGVTVAGAVEDDE